MSSPKNRQQFLELEYCLNSYFNNCFVPVIDSEYSRFRQNAERESQQHRDGGWGGYVDSVSPMAVTHHRMNMGEWNRKTTEDLLKSCNEKFTSNPKVREDIGRLTLVCRATLVGELGVERYKELSKGVPYGDLASYYVINRFKTLFTERLGKMNVPPNSFAYIMQKGIGESLPAVVAGMNMKGSDLDGDVRSLSEKFYGASFGEKTASVVLSFAADSAVTGGYGTVASAATWFVADAGVRKAVTFLPQDKSFDQVFSSTVWGNEGIVDGMRADCRKLRAQSSEDICALNGSLNRPLFKARYDDKDTKARVNELKKVVPQSNGYQLTNVVAKLFADKGIAVNARSSVPKWMEGKEEKELYSQGCYWSSIALQMRSKGLRHVNVNGKSYSLEQVSQRGLDYCTALAMKQSRSALELQSEEVSYDAVMSEGNVQQQYSMQTASSQNVGSVSSPSSSQTSAASMSVDGGGSVVSPQSVQQVQGWGGLFDQMGLGGLGAVGKNLGYVLSMLPDVLIGMFTGKSRNLKFGDNMLPIASVIAGMFVKNPILKMMLVGFGGANLLSKAGKEVLENRDNVKTAPVRQYRQYADEPLDPRVKDPVMKGNTLIVTIDNDPCVITVNEEAADAYYRGVVPLNVLSNAVLRRYDVQKEALHENYERTLSENTSEEVSRGIK